MPTLNPSELANRLKQDLAKISGDVNLLPEINNSNDFAKPYIEIDRLGYNYVCRERGKELFRKLPFDLRELSYEVFKDITHAMAWQWELNNRIEGEDSRRQAFEKQIELMGKIDAEFGERTKKELSIFLKWAPYSK